MASQSIRECFRILTIQIAAILVATSVGRVEPTKNDCVDNYTELEQQVFGENSKLTNEIYRIFYPTNGHFPFSVIVSYENVKKNTSESISTDAYISSDPKCPRQIWVWLSSPSFVLMPPDIVNNLTLFTLNYFRVWTAPKITIPIPKPCPNVTHWFLSQITTSLQDYSLGKLKGKTHPGVVQVGCLKNSKTNIYQLPCTNRHEVGTQTEFQEMCTNQDIASIARLTASVGILFQLAAIWFGSILLLNRNLGYLANKSYTYSFRHYGLLWGVTLCLSLLSTALVILDSTVNIPNVHPSLIVDTIRLYGGIGLIGISLVFGLPIAIYFAYKYESFAIPLIFLVPTQLICCWNKRKAVKIVFGFSLWMQISSIHNISIHACLLLVTLLADTFAVMSTVLFLLLILFCITNIFAILFTSAAYISTPRRLRPQGNCFVILHAVALVFLLGMTCCYSYVFVVGGYIINKDMRLGSFQSIVGVVVLPLLATGIMYCIKKLAWGWMQWSMEEKELHTHVQNEAGVEEQLISPSLLHI